MSLTKKYIYVHHCSFSLTLDNLRNVMGRFWIQSRNTGMQYGFPVDIKPYKMVFGPITSWSRRYFGAIALPAKTQLVRIVANSDLFPSTTISSEPVQLDIRGNPVLAEEEECCGWEDYLKKIDFYSHFTNGNPSQILRKIMNTRLHALSEGGTAASYGASYEAASYEDPIFGADGCKGYIKPKFSLPVASFGDYGSSATGTTYEEQATGGSAVDSSANILSPGPTPLNPDAIPQQEDIGRIRVFRDSWFDINTPFSGEEVDFFEGETSALHSNVEFDYNFYAKGYEDMLAKEKIPEVRVPNLYLNIAPDGSVPFILYLRNQSECRYREFARLITYIGYKDLLIPIKNISWVKSLDIYSESLPMEAKISFGTDNITGYADSIEDSKMDAIVLRRLSEGAAKSPAVIFAPTYTDSTANGDSPPIEEISKFFFAKSYHTPTKSGTSVKPIFGKKDIKTIDFYEWLYAQSLPEIPQNTVPFPGPPNITSEEGGDHIFIGPNNPSIAMSLAEGKYKNNLEYMANFLVLSGRANELTNTYLRSYEQMMLGKTPHSETIAYRIAKFDSAAVRANNSLVQSALSEEGIQIDSVSEEGPTTAISADGYSILEEAITDMILAGAAAGVAVQPIQNIWISNSSNIDIIEYIDTQLLYDKRYTYVVYAYQLAVGTEYFYSKQPVSPEPTPCQGKSGITSDIYGGLSGDLALDLLNSMSTSTDIYNTIINYVNEKVIRNLPEVVPTMFDCEGTIVIAAQETFSAVKLGEAVYSTGYKLYIFCYCFDYEVENIGIDDVIILGEYSPPAADTGTTKEEQEAACEIYTKMSEYLQFDPGLSKDDLLFLGAADYLAPKTTETYYTAEECPDVYKYGTSTATAANANGSKSITYTGWLPGEITKETPNPPSVAVDYTVVKEWEATCECPPPEPCSELFLVTSTPSLKIHEVPYFTWSGRVKDKPPVYPDVEVVPYRAVNDKFLFLIGAGIGDYTAPPIIINHRDRKYFESVLGAQNMKNGLVNFGFDDPISFFEVYRLTDKPHSYKDFSKSSRRVYTTKLSKHQDTRLDAISFIEDVEPNQKYYYIFRAIDIHGHVSNPSPIYEIEIADNDGAIYPLMRIFEPSPNLHIDLDKKGQRLVQVKPAFLQSVINDVQSGLIDAASAHESRKNIKLGVRNSKVWNKNFKLRITSCKTRRSVDLNLGFKTKFVEQEICVEERETKLGDPISLTIPDLTTLLPEPCEDIRRVHEGPIVKVPGAGRRTKSTNPGRSGRPKKREGSVSPKPTGRKKSIY